jgi:hypothetical protein
MVFGASIFSALAGRLYRDAAHTGQCQAVCSPNVALASLHQLSFILANVHGLVACMW